MSLRNLYYHSLAAISLLAGKRPLAGPLILQLNISDECNLDCIMCNRSCVGAKGFMPYKKIISTIDELYSLGLCQLFLHGYGEPFLHPRIMDILNETSLKYPHLQKNIITNGTHITKNMIQTIIENKTNIRFSIHAGDKETWQKIHPHNQANLFDNIQETITRLTQEKKTKTEALFVLFQTNHNNISTMIEFSKKIGLKKIFFRPLRLFKDKTGTKWMNDHLLLSQNQHHAIQKQLITYKNQYQGQIEIDIQAFTAGNYDKKLNRINTLPFYNHKSCYFGWVFSLIETNGNILGCLQESFDKPLGNINKQHFKDIWNSPNYQIFRQQRLLLDKTALKKDDCASWCQHLDVNLKCNHIKKLQIYSLLKEK